MCNNIVLCVLYTSLAVILLHVLHHTYNIRIVYSGRGIHYVRAHVGGRRKNPPPGTSRFDGVP